MATIKEQMEKLGAGEEAIAIRRHLHQYPEIAENEYNTMALICEKLDAWGIPYEKGVADTGVVGLIRGGADGPTVGLRADMDALPIQEENKSVPYCSKIPGVMHACGHDAHTAILLGTAKTLASMADQLHGNVKLLFQPAEEADGGAERMIREGCLENPHVDYVLGLHVEPDIPTGQIAVKYGQMYAASDILTLKIYGTSCHGAHPDEGVDAILIAANILTAVQSVVSRNIRPTNAAVCTFGTIHGGNVRNQVADYVELTGIIRTLDEETRLYARERVRTICQQTAEMLGGRAELIVQESYMSLINDDDIVDLVKGCAADVLGAENVIQRKEPTMGVEDFAYFAAARKSCFFHLGCAFENEPQRIAHNSRFDINEQCIPLGIELQVANVLRLLEK